MTEQEFEQAKAAGQVNFVDPPQTIPEPKGLEPFSPNDYQAIIQALRRPRRHLTAAPTLVPKSFVDQIQFYDDGTNRRIYFYINNTWRYATLT
jgi:hypothetical protein